jgi:TP901 family phage tail tape measure protein
MAKSTIATGLAASLALGVGLAAREYVQFDDAIYGATARFKAAEKPGTDMAKVMENLREAARKTGAETQFTATLAAQGLDKFALAGFTSSEAIAVLKSQVDLATVTGEDFMRVADISSDLLGGFGGSALESSKKIAMLKEMNALLAVGTLSANVTMEDLFETLKMVAPIATQAGKGMADTIATVSVLGSAGIKGSVAATALKNVFLNLSAPTDAVHSALAKLGLTQKDLIDSTGKLKSTVDIFGLIGNGMEKLTKVEQSAVFKDLFGLRGIAGGAVIAQNINQIREQLIRMGKDPQQVMEQTAAMMRQSLGNRIKILASAATEMGFRFFEAFDGDARDGLDSLTESINKFDMKPIVQTVKLILVVVRELFRILGPSLPILLGVVAAVKAWVIAQAALNFLLAANPVGLTIAAVVALGIAIKDLVDNWDLYSLNFKLKLHEILLGWQAIKYQVLDVMATLGMMDKAVAQGAFKEFGMSLIESDIMTAQRALLMKKKGLDPGEVTLRSTGRKFFSSPESMKSETTTNNNTTLDVNINGAPKGSTAKASGRPAPGLTLNYGVN